MSWTIPNKVTANYQEQARLWSSNLNDLRLGISGYGVMSGGEVTFSTTTTFDVAGGVAMFGPNGWVPFVADTVTVDVDGTPPYPRVDIVQVDPDGVISVVQGNSTGVEPAVSLWESVIPCIKLAAIYVNNTTLSASHISDRRIEPTRPTFYTVPGCKLKRTSAQAISSGGSGAAISFPESSAEWNALFHSDDVPTRITVPSGYGGVYAVQASVEYEANATGRRVTSLRLNDTTVMAKDMATYSSASDAYVANLSCLLSLSPTDFLELVAYQDSGSSLNVGVATSLTWMSIYLVNTF